MALDLVGYSTVPARPQPGVPFEVHLFLDYVSCDPAVEDVQLTDHSIHLLGAVGPRPGGGCDGSVRRDVTLIVPMEPLTAGEYELAVDFILRPDGPLLASMEGVVVVGAPLSVPSVSNFGAALLALCLCLIGLRRAA